MKKLATAGRNPRRGSLCWICAATGSTSPTLATPRHDLQPPCLRHRCRPFARAGHRRPAGVRRHAGDQRGHALCQRWRPGRQPITTRKPCRRSACPVGQHAWVQAGAGKSRTDQRAGRGASGRDRRRGRGRGQPVAATDAQREPSSRWRPLPPDGLGLVAGLATCGRRRRRRCSQSGRSQAAGLVVAPDGQGGSANVPAQVRLAGTGLGAHGSLPVTDPLERLRLDDAQPLQEQRPSDRSHGAGRPAG